MTPEGKVKDAVKKILKAANIYYHMPVQNGMGAPSLDIIGCRKVTITADMVGREMGLYFAIETKAPGKKPTPRQELTISEIEDSAGKTFVIDGDVTSLNEWLKGECDGEVE